MDILLVFSEQEINQMREDLIEVLRNTPHLTYQKLADDIGISRWTLTQFLYRKKTLKNAHSRTIAAIKKYIDTKSE